ncbi:MAG: hypothetical protein DRP08_01000 [Candidatus Aenigmatarchaeota archaeon]|nr:MAG: hypothetical protein DRP08_01000 [Candidatus Aenigmarchaeota archaeon]
MKGYKPRYQKGEIVVGIDGDISGLDLPSLFERKFGYKCIDEEYDKRNYGGNFLLKVPDGSEEEACKKISSLNNELKLLDVEGRLWAEPRDLKYEERCNTQDKISLIVEKLDPGLPDDEYNKKLDEIIKLSENAKE